ncbi:MAG: nucleotidyl transferase AbiEii/AbiGii toxin family protein [Deltaproteobacteria bacterium]|nr:nucleotidyl transferase AbiEii/AbiGii toxin family protein [Deltaproteobacteria bacterium]
MPVLSDLETPWTLGGGTGLFLSLNHRVSYDIDIFLEDPRGLKTIAGDPRTKRISSDWQFPGNYLKLIRQEGEIDFILAATITENCFFAYDFKGIEIKVETPAEIIAKKIRYRGSNFTIRDIFDFALAADHDPQLMVKLSQALLRKDFQKTLDRVTLLKHNFSEDQSISQFINILKTSGNLAEIYDVVIKHLKSEPSRP